MMIVKDNINGLKLNINSIISLEEAEIGQFLCIPSVESVIDISGQKTI